MLRYALPKTRGGDGRPEDFRFPKKSYPQKIMVFCGLKSNGKTESMKDEIHNKTNS